MKKRFRMVSLLLSFGMMFCFSACSEGIRNGDEAEGEMNWKTQQTGTIMTRPQINDGNIYEILPDLNFSRGFKVSLFHSNSSGGRLSGVLNHGGEAAEGGACWQLSQWGCTHDLADAECVRAGRSLQYDDGGKSVELDVGKTSEITLSIRGSEEYTRDADGNIRERTDPTENWPHLLLEQTGVDHAISPEAKHLWMTLTYEIRSCESKVDRTLYPENPAVNAAQFQWFLNLTDSDPESESYQERMWFGFSMFDTRSIGSTPGGMSSYDGGKEDSSGLFIYMFSLENAAREKDNIISLPSSVIGGGMHTVKVDVLPLLSSALKAAKKSGALKGASVDCLTIDSTNIGWELPGNYDVSVAISGLNLYEVK